MLIGLAMLLTAASAEAQRPVCAPVGPDEKVKTTCLPFSLFPVVDFLADFTVDQLFKPAPPPIRRDVLEAVQLLAGKPVSDNPELQQFLAALSPLHFTQLDRTTGSVLADFEGDKRELKTRLEGLPGSPTLILRAPLHLQGGYWRGPDVLQVAFWDKGRFALRMAVENGPALEGEVECVALSPDGVLVRFAPATTPPLLALFRECPQ